MIRDLAHYKRYQVFLNYPFDEAYDALSLAMQFTVVAAGLLPVCAKDLTTPDRPRLDMLIDAIRNCHYSIHDLSRSTGEGDDNFVRMNMPIETGMALYHALTTQREEHRCAFFVSTSNDYKKFASDLSGLDPICHNNSDTILLSDLYEWLRKVVPENIINQIPTITIRDKYSEYKSHILNLNGSASNGLPTHEEKREVMYKLCNSCGWWDWRNTKAGLVEFPIIPLSWKSTNEI